MAGSGLPWVQIRTDWSSDVLSIHCLLRLQLTLLTGLSCPAYKERFGPNLKLQCVTTKCTFKVPFSESSRMKPRGSRWPTGHLYFSLFISAAPLWGLCCSGTILTSVKHSWMFGVDGSQKRLFLTITVCRTVKIFCHLGFTIWQKSQIVLNAFFGI